MSVTSAKHRHEYNQNHADEPRHLDLLTIGICLAVTVLLMLLFSAFILGLLWIVGFLGGLLPSEF